MFRLSSCGSGLGAQRLGDLSWARLKARLKACSEWPVLIGTAGMRRARLAPGWWIPGALTADGAGRHHAHLAFALQLKMVVTAVLAGSCPDDQDGDYRDEEVTDAGDIVERHP
jgi:hypothetical protein